MWRQLTSVSKKAHSEQHTKQLQQFAMKLISCCSFSVLLLALFLAGFRQVAMYPSLLEGTLPFTQVDYFSGLTLNFNETHLPDLSGRIVLITGANSGLGFANSKFVAKKGARLIMACRTLSKCDNARKEILALTGANLGKITIMRLDLGDLQSIKDFCNLFKEKFGKLHHLVLNAGIGAESPEVILTKDGIEQMFGVNHVGHFYLTKLLVDTMVPFDDILPTIVAISSAVHHVASSLQLSEKPFKSTDLLSKINDPLIYSPMTNYGISKAANILFANELAERNPNILVNSVHPGAVLTPLATRIISKAFSDILELFATDRIVYRPDTSVMTQLYASLSSEIQEKKFTGRYFIPNAQEAQTSSLVQDKQAQKDLWEFTEELLKVKGFT